MPYEFLEPDFIKDNDPDTIQARMMANLPVDISSMPGDFAYDFTMPTAIEKAELIQFHLVRTLMLMFPMYAWGDWLDLHAQQVNITRKGAGYAYGMLTVTGAEGTVIAAGKVFCTAATDSASSLEYEATETVVIGAGQTEEVEVKARQPGTLYNVERNTVCLMRSPIKGVSSVTNPERITGGTDQEEDSALLERVMEAYQDRGYSFVGNDSDYIRWAKEVVGVGAASVIPEWDGPGTVKLILIDSNGQPANEHICEDVYNYIMRPDDRLQRKAPIGAILTVSSPDIIQVSYAATVELLDGYGLEDVKEAFLAGLLKYYDRASQEGEIKYTQIGSVLANTAGVNDYENLLLNGGTKNIKIHQYEFPVTLEASLESGVVG